MKKSLKINFTTFQNYLNIHEWELRLIDHKYLLSLNTVCTPFQI